MVRFIYTDEHIEFIREQYQSHGVAEVAYMFFVRFGIEKTPQQIKCTISNHKITCGRKPGEILRGKLRSFTDEQAEFIKQAYKHYTIEQITERFNAKFGTNKTVEQIRVFTRNHKVKSGRTGYFHKGQAPWNKGKKHPSRGRSAETQFKKGDTPINHRPVGSERVNVDGYIEMKTAEPNVWEFKQRVIYEAEHGVKLTTADIVRFRDGDPLNCDPSNLILLTRAENAVLNQLKIKHIPEQVEPVVKTLLAVKRQSAKRAKV